jgi:hypothetical protein
MPQAISEYGEPQWNENDRVKQRNSEKNLFHCHFVHQKFHMDRSGREPGPPR